jgi:hypothetical protein
MVKKRRLSWLNIHVSPVQSVEKSTEPNLVLYVVPQNGLQNKKRFLPKPLKRLILLVGVRGFEPPTP